MERKILIDLVKRQTETFASDARKSPCTRVFYKIWLLGNATLSQTSFLTAKQNLPALKIILQEITRIKNSRNMGHFPKQLQEDVITLKCYLEDYINFHSTPSTD